MQFIKQTLSKDERLKSRKLIGNLFDKGKVINNSPFKVLYSLTDSDEFIYPAKVAISVTKRNFKRAVDRNHIKRKIREAYRKNKFPLYDFLNENDQKLYFFVIYTAKDNLTYKEIEKEMIILIGKIIKRLSYS